MRPVHAEARYEPAFINQGAAEHEHPSNMVCLMLKLPGLSMQPRTHTVHAYISGSKWAISCQNEGPFLGTLNHRCRIVIGTQKGTIIFTTTQVYAMQGSLQREASFPGRGSTNRAQCPHVGRLLRPGEDRGRWVWI